MPVGRPDLIRNAEDNALLNHMEGDQP
ncbi:hypothetical protein RAZWK3B_10261 [Roseobacter sp. AzwK-3b]|nr:hypothetical protein RAZWK3B_10261 [Roseobacter sp. AzwK-3b]